ncbi:MAG: hypothetical protein JNM56_25515 [Planctomycetia bacterium]|nr:hypothetical protein [Planctomycetia bacterium]
MDDSLCLPFFRQPTQTLHRRYEALRAFFVDHRPLPEIATAFGYRYGTLRNLVTEFRAQCRADQVPPFSPHPAGDGQSTTIPAQRSLTCRRSLTAGNWSGVRDNAGARASPESSSSCPCWPSSVSLTWSPKPVTPVPAWCPQPLPC